MGARPNLRSRGRTTILVHTVFLPGEVSPKYPKLVWMAMTTCTALTYSRQCAPVGCWPPSFKVMIQVSNYKGVAHGGGLSPKHQQNARTTETKGSKRAQSKKSRHISDAIFSYIYVATIDYLHATRQANSWLSFALRVFLSLENLLGEGP